MGNKDTLSFAPNETLSLFTKPIHYTNILEKSRTKGSLSAHRMCRNMTHGELSVNTLPLDNNFYISIDF